MSSDSVPTPIPAPALALGIAGLIPFAVGAISLWGPLPYVTADLGLPLVITYGAVILAFLGGIRWGTAMGPYDGRRQGLEFTTSALGPLAGLAAAFLPAVPGLTLLIAGFLLQALWDVTSVESGRLPQWFGRLRMVLMAGAVISLIATLAALVI